MSKLLYVGVAAVACATAVALAVRYYREPALDEAWRDRPDEYPYRQ